MNNGKQDPSPVMEAMQRLLSAVFAVAAAGGVLWLILVHEGGSGNTFGTGETVGERAALVAPESAIRPEIASLAELIKERGSEWAVTDLVHELGGSLNDDEVAELAETLKRLIKSDGDGEVSAVDLNEVLNLLRWNRYSDPSVLKLLASVHRDRQQDDEVRDYALQHSEAWLRTINYRTGKLMFEDPGDRSGVYDLLRSAAGQATQAYAGTAASSLADLAKSFPDEVEAKNLDAMVMRLCGGEDVNKLTKITAFQLAAERGLKGALPRARRIVADVSADPSLRLSAIAAVGALGTTSDIELLKTIEASNARFEPALKTATERLNQRLERE